MTELLKFINRIQEIDEKTEEAIKFYFEKEHYKKNEYILKENKICTKISFIESGLVRRFYLEDGEEVTKWIYYDNQWIGSMSSFYRQEPSFEFIQASEDTTVYSLSNAHEQALLEYPLFFKFYALFLRQSLAAFYEFHFVFTSMTAQKKYSYLIEKFPLIIQKAKQKHVASLLNVSPETLSRIRAEIY